MLISAVLELSARGKDHFTFNGPQIYDWFFDWLKTVDTERFHALHTPALVKPFTLSGITRSQGGAYCARITAFGSDLAIWLEHHLRGSLPATITIGGVNYDVISVWTDAEHHPWAGQTTYQDLVARYLNGCDPGRKFSLYFTSPTAFHSRDHIVPLPTPALVLGSLTNRWHAYAPVTLDEAIRDIAAVSIAPSHYRLRTEAVRIGRSWQVGFVGRCEFIVLAMNPYWRHVCHLLAAFAFYSGVGHKTALGMGQVQPFQKQARCVGD